MEPEGWIGLEGGTIACGRGGAGWGVVGWGVGRGWSIEGTGVWEGRLVEGLSVSGTGGQGRLPAEALGKRITMGLW